MGLPKPPPILRLCREIDHFLHVELRGTRPRPPAEAAESFFEGAQLPMEEVTKLVALQLPEIADPVAKILEELETEGAVDADASRAICAPCSRSCRATS